MKLENVSTKQKAIASIILGLILIIALAINMQYSKNKTPNAKQHNNDVLNPVSTESSSQNYSYIEITGQVVSPGVYQIDNKLMVIELIELAGGLTEHADLQNLHQNISLASIVEDRQKIYIPGSFEQKTENNSQNGQSENSISEKININTATEAQLDALPDVGPATAKKIISSRPFKSIEDLKDVEGIGEKTFNNLVSLIIL